MKNIFPNHKRYRLLRSFRERPGIFYQILLSVVAMATAANLFVFFNGGQILRGLLPAYTHVLLLTIGTIYLFRGLHIVGALLWVSVLGQKDCPPPYRRDRGDLPTVTVQIPLRNEPLDIAKISINSAFALNYPAEKLEIQLIDNSNGEEFIRPIKDYLERKASEGPAEGGRPKTAFIHREGTAGFKARNLNLGLRSANGEFFLILDADSWVHADTLLSALPYFRADPKLGFLQLRIDPLNEERNIISMSAAIMVRARYKVMALRDTQGLVQFDGHNGVFRREALESVGGWSEQVSEDLATSVKVVLAGYRARYANLPSGELVPSSLRELINQRKRWATGTMFFLRHDALSILKSSRLRWFEKLDLLFAALYIILEALICALVLTFAPLPIVSVLTILLAFSLLPTCLVAGAGPWRTIRRQASLIFVVSAILPALLQGAAAGMSNRELSFDVTRKFENVRMTVTDFMLSHGFGFAIALLFFSGAAWLCSGPVDFLNKYLAGTIIMGSVVAAPIMLELKSVRDRRAPNRSGS